MTLSTKLFTFYFDTVKNHFDHKNKNGFFVIFNGSGLGSSVTICRTRIKLPMLWRPLLPARTDGDPIVEKPKVFLFLVRIHLIHRKLYIVKVNSSSKLGRFNSK